MISTKTMKICLPKKINDFTIYSYFKTFYFEHKNFNHKLKKFIIKHNNCKWLKKKSNLYKFSYYIYQETRNIFLCVGGWGMKKQSPTKTQNDIKWKWHLLFQLNYWHLSVNSHIVCLKHLSINGIFKSLVGTIFSR